MPTYNFKKDSKFYVVRSGLRYSLDVYPDFSCSQTFEETAVQVKTLHSQFDMFEDATITKASPANFSLTCPILVEHDLDIMLELLKDYDGNTIEAQMKTADLYVVSNSETYKLEKAVIEGGTFTLSNNAPITLSLSGSASKLSRYVGTVPGTPVARSATRTYGRITTLAVTVGGVLQPSITSVSIELKNNVQWLDFATLQNSLQISGASGTQFPGAFVVSSRVLSGTIQQYLTDETATNANTWNTNSSINVKASHAGTTMLEFAIPKVVYTNRLEVQDLFLQSYDFRMSGNPLLANVIKKV
jgi:hypothetical protein